MSKVRDDKQPTAVRGRAYLIGLLLVCLICGIISFSELVASRASSIQTIMLGANQMSPAVIGVLLAIVGANALARRVTGRCALRPSEIGMVYVMMACAALISSFGLVGLLLPTLVGGSYFEHTLSDASKDLLHSVPRWLLPFDPTGPANQPVVRSFYEGLRDGERIPWGAWITPLAAWSAFALLLFFCMACMVTLVRKQWVEHERLAFPLVQVPLEVLDEHTKPRGERMILLAGALVPFAVHSMNGIHGAFPNIPQIPTFIISTWGLFSVLFSVIGFSYLLPLDVSFSMWFFPLFFRLQSMVGLFLGYHSEPMPNLLGGGCPLYAGYQSIGAAFAVVIALLWSARQHFRDVWATVWRDDARVRADNEMMSYRTAFWGLVISLLLMIYWCVMAGVSVGIAAFVILSFVLMTLLVATRCVAEVGVLNLEHTYRPIDIWGVFAAKSSLGAGALAPLVMLSPIIMRHPRTIMSAIMDGQKLADGVGLNRRKLAMGLLLGIPVAMVTAYGIQLWIAYTYGAMRLNSWFTMAVPTLHLTEFGQLASGGGRFDANMPTFFGIGALFTAFLYVMRTRYWWWPFHPLGYAMGAWWTGTIWWSMFLVGWLIKSAVVRYGGMRLFRRVRPFFIGLILGEFVTALLWALISPTLGIAAPTIPFN